MATVTTLPATFVAGSVLIAAQMNDLRGAFRVLQVVTGTTTATTSNSTTTMADTTLSATITPTSTSSKILVIVNHSSCTKNSVDANNAINLILQRDGVTVTAIQGFGGRTVTAMQLHFGVNSSFLDSPATTATLIYKTQFANVVASAAVSVQQDAPSTIHLLEISA